ncbi:unnamed protein product [Echinostoma caproni]|uniref:Ferrochelatase n=1 Tax=Echinostoma caproni TaxID=27848 RepID=A0A183AU34_9TREM|nr:unnamed protein product [Echinostoma caproni]
MLAKYVNALTLRTGPHLRGFSTKQQNSRPKTAVIMLNMGGPSSKEYVHDFLLRLFSDKEIIDLPAQSDGVERAVAFSQYPHFSCTTSGSSFNAIARHYTSTQGTFTGVETVEPPTLSGGTKKTIWSLIDRWPLFQPLVTAFADHIKHKLMSIEDPQERERVVLLFSAHSIPLSVVNRGDPYPAVSDSISCVIASTLFSEFSFMGLCSIEKKNLLLSLFPSISLSKYKYIHIVKFGNYCESILRYVYTFKSSTLFVDLRVSHSLSVSLPLQIGSVPVQLVHPQFVYVGSLAAISEVHIIVFRVTIMILNLDVI